MALSLHKETQSVAAESMRQAERACASLLRREEIGFLQLTERDHLWQQSQKLGYQLSQKFKSLVVVGIGGSSLGARVIAECAPQAKRNLFFLDNVDEIGFTALMQSLNLSETAWLVISKSGTSIETLMGIDCVREWYKRHEVSFYDKVVAISEPRENALTTWAKEHSIPVAEIPVDVGGRFSVLTPVGMIPAAFLGLDVELFRQGARDALNNSELIQNLVAHSLQSFSQEKWITVFWNYSSLLRWFGGWVQQLWAESLAKKTTRSEFGAKVAPRASTPLAAIGTCDQHSILQQVMEGAHDKFVVFLQVEASQGQKVVLHNSDFSVHSFLNHKSLGSLMKAEADATAEALAIEGVQSITLKTLDLSPKSLGEMFMVFQLWVGALGEALKIDAFDQPGVELGKRIAKEKLKNS